MVDGRSGDFGMSRPPGEGSAIRLVVYPEAYQGFDNPRFKTPVESLGYHLEFNQSATDQSIDALREFLHATLGRRQQMASNDGAGARTPPRSSRRKCGASK